MLESITMLWPQITAAVVVSFASWLVTRIVKAGVTVISEKMDTLATKEFVTHTILTHHEKIAKEMNALFEKSSNQNVVNLDIEMRMRRIEVAAGLSGLPPKG